MELPKSYLSPSSLCLFKSNTSLWCGRYLFGWSDAAGPAAWRGSAVEAGLDAILFRSEMPNHLERALSRFELDAQGDASDDVQKHRDLIAPMLAQAQAAIAEANLPVPVGRQFKIEWRHPKVHLPVLGYIDYLFADFSFDLKTTERLPSEPRPDHVLAQSIYAEAAARPSRLLYVTPKKHAWFEVSPEMQERGLEEAIRLAGTIRNFLRLADNPHDLIRAVPVDFSDFRWSDELKKCALETIAA